LAWPLVKSAAALLTEVAEGEDPGPSRPSFTQSLSGVTSPGLLGAN
jgi:nicotinate-nucleotide--dimethylbenzimidazole phosphoribosyltransferase